MFNEANTVEAFLRDQLSGGIQQTTASPGFVRKGRSLLGAGWHTLAPQDLPRQPNNLFIETDRCDGLIRLNPGKPATLQLANLTPRRTLP
jgi:type I restriction enzyme R subunit